MLNKSYALEFRNLRTESAQFWVVSEPAEDGAGTRFTMLPQPVRRLSAGILLEVPAQSSPWRIVGQIQSSAPVKPKLFLWLQDQFEESNLQSSRFGGALFGTFLGLAGFSLMIAVLNRSLIYLLFAGWLVTSLRVAAVNGGWTLPWLGLQIDPTTNASIMVVTMAAHGVLTQMLFLMMFGQAMGRSRVRTLLKMGTVATLILIPLGPFMPYGPFQRTFYALTITAFIGFMIGLFRVFRRKPSTTAFWYSVSFMIMIVALVTEMMYQVSWLQSLSGWLNAQVAAILSALITGVALAERMRTERAERVLARKGEMAALQKVEDNYHATPMALFTLDERMNLRMCNRAFLSMFPGVVLDAGQVVTLDQILGKGTTDDLRVNLSNQSICEVELYGESAGMPACFQLRIARKADQYDGSIQDITARKAAEDQLLHLVTHDALTNLLNRRGYDAALKEALAGASPRAAPGAGRHHDRSVRRIHRVVRFACGRRRDVPIRGRAAGACPACRVRTGRRSVQRDRREPARRGGGASGFEFRCAIGSHAAMKRRSHG